MAKPSGYLDEAVTYASGYGELIDAVLEYVPDLTWPLSVRTYSRMRWDPQLAAILKAFTLPIRRSTWSVDGSGCRPEVVALIADDLGLPVLGGPDTPTGARRRGVDWYEHLRLALLDLTFGHMPFEQTWTEVGGRMRLTALSERMPQTVESIRIDDQGAITAVEQRARAGSAGPVTIPAKNLVWYAHEREGAAWFGQSLLRPSYAPWLIKDQVMRVHATSIRRFGLGILEVQAPPGATPQQVAEAQRYAGSITASDQAGAGLPAGFTSSLRGLTGSVPDAVAFITYLDQQMTRSTLSSILDMATSIRGNRSLGQTIMDMFTLALQAIADTVGGQATTQIVVPLVTANFGEDEPAPKITCGDVGAQNQVTAESLNQLFQFGALTPDPALEGWVREEFKLPARETPWVAPHVETPTSRATTPAVPVAAAAAQPTDTQTVDEIAALMAAGLPAAALAAQVGSLLTAAGVSAAVADSALTMIGASSARTVPTIGAAARATAAGEAAARAAYLLAASRRVQAAVDAGVPLGQALDGETRFYAQHLAAQEKRRHAAQTVDAAAGQHGGVLGWKATVDDATTADCLAADGRNFAVDRMPAIGWPGAVHPNCRCRPVAPFAGAGMVGDAAQRQEAVA